MVEITWSKLVDGCTLGTSKDNSTQDEILKHVTAIGDDVDGIQWMVMRTFYVNNMAVMEEINGKRSFEITVRDSYIDYITDFKTTTPGCRCVATVFGSDVPLLRVIPLASTPYTDIKLRVYINDNDDVKKVNVSYVATVLSSKKRAQMRSCDINIGNDMICTNGSLLILRK